jgi:hypothetical protein
MGWEILNQVQNDKAYLKDRKKITSFLNGIGSSETDTWEMILDFQFFFNKLNDNLTVLT